MIPSVLECLTSLCKSLPQGSDLFIPIVPILSVLGWMGYSLFYLEQN